MALEKKLGDHQSLKFIFWGPDCLYVKALLILEFFFSMANKNEKLLQV